MLDAYTPKALEMKGAAVNRDRTTGAAVLRRVDEPTDKEPCELPQAKHTANDKAAGGGSASIKAPLLQIASQHTRPGAGKHSRYCISYSLHYEFVNSDTPSRVALLL